MKTMQSRALLLGASSLGALALATPALAQVPQQPIPPEHYTQDPRGVDLVSGQFSHVANEVVIGQPGQGGLAHGRIYLSPVPGRSAGWRDTLAGTINASGSTYVVSIGGDSEVFTKSGSTFTPASARGYTLTQTSGTVYVFKTPDGATATFMTDWQAFYTPYEANIAVIQNFARPNGDTTTYSYKSADICVSRDPNGCVDYVAAARLQSVETNRGYQLHYDYVSDDPEFGGYDWIVQSKVTGINLVEEFCNALADDCTLVANWPSITYDAAIPTTATDQSNRTTTYGYGAGGLDSIRFPGSSSPDIAIAYHPSFGGVSRVVDTGGQWDYTYTDVGTTRTTVADGPENLEITAVIDRTIGRATSVENEPGEKWEFEYDSQNRLDRTIAPEGNAVQLTYDGRGNIIKTAYQAVPDPLNPLPDLEVTATYPSSCSTTVACNMPLTTTDPNSNTTTYTWDSTHGGLLSVTPPVPSSGAPQPQAVYTYSSLTARFHNSASTYANGTAIVMPVSTYACATGTYTFCSFNPADQVKTTLAYASSSTPNNLLPISSSTGAGFGPLVATTEMTWTANGDLSSTTGPLGSDYKTEYRYNAGRELIGVIGPRRNSGSPHHAVRYTRNPRGQVELTEAGTTTNYGDSGWATFSALQRQETTYGTYGRVMQIEAQSSAGTTRALTQMSYDAAGRVSCSAVRMNPTTFASPPGSACSLSTTGVFGPDRILQTTYDNAGRPSSTTSGLGTGAAVTESLTYTDNGQVETLTDGKGNVSTLTYDRYDRVSQLTYPGGTLSEQYGYDAASNVTSYTDRSGRVFTNQYDNLNRLKMVFQPSPTPVQAYTYDNLGRMTSSNNYASGTVTMTWDALGRLTSQGGVLGAMTFKYDLAGRRTALVWPDSIEVEYSYDPLNNVTGIYPAGGPAISTYAYDNLGRRTSVTRPNGVNTSYSYDDVSRLTGLSIEHPTSTYDQVWTYGYNPAGQVIAQSQSNDLYAFTGRTAGTTSYTNNILNQATVVGGSTLSYNDEGDLTSDPSTGRTYAYDRYSRPVTLNSSQTLTWDALGRLKTMTGTTGADYLYDSDGQLAGTTVNGSTIANRLVPGPWTDELAMAYQGSDLSLPYWSAQDRMGSVVSITDSSGGMIGINTYDEYGRPGSGNVGRLMYTGQMWMPDWGMYHYKNRQYRPDLGRFLQTDPIGYAAGFNLYSYVNGDPINWTDPTGLERFTIRVCTTVNSGGTPGTLEDVAVTTTCRDVDIDIPDGPTSPGNQTPSGASSPSSPTTLVCRRDAGRSAQSKGRLLPQITNTWIWRDVGALQYYRNLYARDAAQATAVGMAMSVGGLIGSGASLLQRQGLGGIGARLLGGPLIGAAVTIAGQGVQAEGGLKEGWADAIQDRLDAIESCQIG